MIAGILWGYQVRFRLVLSQWQAVAKCVAIITTEIILRGYRVEQIGVAWCHLQWSTGRQEMIRRLATRQERNLGTEGKDWRAGASAADTLNPVKQEREEPSNRRALDPTRPG